MFARFTSQASEPMMMIGYPPSVNKFRPEQIAQMSTWTTVPDADTKLASIHVIHAVPDNASTCTYVNPLDPGGMEAEWRIPPDRSYGPVRRARGVMMA